MTTYFSDSFNRANATSLGIADTGQTWASASGSGISNNQAYATNGTWNNNYVNLGLLDNIIFQATLVSLATSDTLYLYFQSQDTNISNRINITASAIKIEYFNFNEGLVTILNYAYSIKSGDIIGVKIQGKTYSLMVNNTVIQTVTGKQTSNLFGFNASNSTTKIDDIIVKDINSTPTGTPVSSSFLTKQSVYRSIVANNDVTNMFFKISSFLSDLTNRIYKVSNINNDIKNEIYKSNLENNDLQIQSYQQSQSNMDSEQIMFKNIANSFLSSQEIYTNQLSVFDTLQQIVSTGIVTIDDFSIKLMLYKNDSITPMTKQVIYTPKTDSYSTKQQIYQQKSFLLDTFLSLYKQQSQNMDSKLIIFNQSSTPLSTEQLIYENKTSIHQLRHEMYLRQSLNGNIQQILYKLEESEYQTKQQIYTTSVSDFDTLQYLLSDWHEYRKAIKYIFTINQKEKFDMKINPKSTYDLKITLRQKFNIKL